MRIERCLIKGSSFTPCRGVSSERRYRVLAIHAEHESFSPNLWWVIGTRIDNSPRRKRHNKDENPPDNTGSIPRLQSDAVRHDGYDW